MASRHERSSTVKWSALKITFKKSIFPVQMTDNSIVITIVFSCQFHHQIKCRFSITLLLHACLMFVLKTSQTYLKWKFCDRHDSPVSQHVVDNYQPNIANHCVSATLVHAIGRSNHVLELKIILQWQCMKRRSPFWF